MHVFRSMILDAKIDLVWQLVRPFDGVVTWNPGVTQARMEQGTPTEPGSVRHLDIVDGSVFRETLLALSDTEWSYTYDILDGPLPVTNYVSTHRFIPITATDQTLGIWESWFDCDSDQRAKMDEVVGDQIYLNGMAGLNQKLKDIRNG
ncbi:MAG: SRPBCC family protein [Pseudomonadota bacterium]